MHTIDFLPEVEADLRKQLIGDGVKYGDTWLLRTRKGQEWRTMKTIARYFFQYFVFGKPMPWLKVMGEAHICRTRDTHPELWPL